MGLFDFTRTRRYRNFMAKVYGLGASVVLIGALFKINHYPGADYWLIIGLGTEAIIFFFSAFEPPHVEPDWSLVYPELAGMYHGVKGGELKDRKTATQRLDEMLEKAKIDQKTIEKLGTGLEKLSENATQLSDLSSAAVATTAFTTNMKSATESAQSLALSYAKSAEIMDKSVETFNQTAVEGSSYYDQLKKISENLSSLNAMYELQLQGSNSVVESSEKMQTVMSVFLENLERSTESTAEFTDQMATLTNRMSSLNKVYGNMLTAMNVNG